MATVQTTSQARVAVPFVTLRADGTVKAETVKVPQSPRYTPPTYGWRRTD